jgi:Ca2+-binding EF-hand superfamily protein
LQNFDRHHNKRITTDQAIRALQMARVTLTPNEVTALQQQYGTDSGYFSYGKLLDGVFVSLYAISTQLSLG